MTADERFERNKELFAKGPRCQTTCAWGDWMVFCSATFADYVFHLVNIKTPYETRVSVQKRVEGSSASGSGRDLQPLKRSIAY